MIDWNRVHELQDEIGKSDFEEIVEIFLDEVEQVIDKLQNHPNRERLGNDLHFLKGCALNLGFKDFSQICQAGETACTRGESDLVDVPAVLRSYEISKQSFQQGLETPS